MCVPPVPVCEWLAAPFVEIPKRRPSFIAGVENYAKKTKNEIHKPAEREREATGSSERIQQANKKNHAQENAPSCIDVQQAIDPNCVIIKFFKFVDALQQNLRRRHSTACVRVSVKIGHSCSWALLYGSCSIRGTR